MIRITIGSIGKGLQNNISALQYGKSCSFTVDAEGTKVEYRRFGSTYYIRLDRGDEVISSIIAVCAKENIGSATYSGIGGCSKAQIQTFLPETNEFETRTIAGMLELVSLTGNVISDEEGGLYPHTHAVFAYKDGENHRIAAGHIKSIAVLYTAEIELRPTMGGAIGRRHDPETGTGFWSFSG